MKRQAYTATFSFLFGFFVSGMAVSAHADTSRLNDILAAERLRVCIWPDYYSISYRDPRSQELSGVDVVLARELAKDLAVDVDFVDSSFARVVGDVQGGRCDVAMFAIGITPERQKHLSFTQPHLVSDVLAITTRNNRTIRSWSDLDQPGNVLAVAKGTVQEPLMRERLQHAELVAVDSPHTREQEVISGRADAFITDLPYTRRMLETTDWARLVEPPETYHLSYYAWALKPGDPQWQARLDDFMHTIKNDGRLLQAARKYGLEQAVVLE